MKINKSTIKIALGIVFISIAFIGCQEMDKPESGDYAKDINPPGGPLKFYVPFDDNTTDPLRFAVDHIRAKYPNSNPLSETEGINGKGVKGNLPKIFIAYSNANDFATTASSFTVAFWSKHDTPTQPEFAFTLTSSTGTAGACLYLTMGGTTALPIIKLYVDEQPTTGTSAKSFDWTTTNAVPGVFDNQWHHFAFVYDATTSTMVLYKDGIAYQPISQWTNHGPIKFNTSKINGFRIGGSGKPTTTDSWTGSLDQYRMYATALTVSEVNALFSNKL